jgi:hypothetical protein
MKNQVSPPCFTKAWPIVAARPQRTPIDCTRLLHSVST